MRRDTVFSCSDLLGGISLKNVVDAVYGIVIHLRAKRDYVAHFCLVKPRLRSKVYSNMQQYRCGWAWPWFIRFIASRRKGRSNQPGSTLPTDLRDRLIALEKDSLLGGNGDSYYKPQFLDLGKLQFFYR
jgi:hypothetical protein